MHRLFFSDATRNIDIKMATTLKDPLKKDEQFYVVDIRTIDSYLEQELFYCWVKGVPYTLNEMIFFAVNNQLALDIYGETDHQLIAHYGA
ncbi:hypothetical protein [Chitinophaga arvensicola]|uniref:Uncharacterized protein n=1 Tax=Chitinophaga arvensicola TaxID=29529 RepID=A0A1I0R993_9BACT|nr:hypothetical protein [Chitinophaga arvensicola]SEW37383.1 hypothetical protein SAMN04488122_2501 [Chitinophaga arvensicola]